MRAKKLTKSDRVQKIFKKARIDCGYTQETVSKHFGVVPSAVSRWESDYRRMNVDLFERYCRYLHLDPAVILSEKGA